MSDLTDAIKAKLISALDAGEQAITDQWKKGEPYRQITGALLSGDPGMAKQILAEKAAQVSPQDLQNGIMSAGMGFAPMGIGHIQGALPARFNFDRNYGQPLMPIKDSYGQPLSDLPGDPFHKNGWEITKLDSTRVKQ